MVVKRTPTSSAAHPMTTPPKPNPSQTREFAKAGIERNPLSSVAIGLSATGTIHAVPNATDKTMVATLAMTQDLLESIGRLRLHRSILTRYD
jgi:hypothetical protein